MTDVPCILGCDPGLKGAIAFYFASYDKITVEDMPVANGDVDAATLAERIRQMLPTVAIVEGVHSMPKQGVASSFKFGKGYGTVLGVIAALGVPVHIVAPTAWKKHFRLNSDKDASRALALRYWPDRSEMFCKVKHDGRAEAALIARFYAEKILK
jgi:hypothetical protein